MTEPMEADNVLIQIDKHGHLWVGVDGKILLDIETCKHIAIDTPKIDALTIHGDDDG